MVSKPQRRSPKQARARATWDAIVEAAAQILERRGTEALNTNDVAERAGVSIGTLYQYFPDKQAILVAAAKRELGRAPLPGRHGALIQALIGMLDQIGHFGASAQARTVSKAPPLRSRARRRPSQALEQIQALLIDLIPAPAPMLRPIPIQASRRRGDKA